MQNRLGFGVVCVFVGLFLGQLLSPRATTAQIGSNRGFFASLKVGDMVETAFDGAGKTVLRTYDDEANRARMIAQVVEVGGEHIVVEVKATDPASKEVWSIRYPIHSIGSIFHVTGATTPGGTEPPAAPAEGGKKKTRETKSKKAAKDS